MYMSYITKHDGQLAQWTASNDLRQTFIPIYYYNRISKFKLIELLKVRK